MKRLLPLLWTVAAALPVASATIEVGRPFPEMTLPGLDGEPGSISDFRGRKVVLHVFASW